jgi:Arc/MetJ-type ribon-helix-helix transcriptional regulator
MALNLVYLITDGAPMSAKTVVLRLNQQQLELIDRTIARGEASDRVALVRRALRELAARRGVARAEAGR